MREFGQTSLPGIGSEICAKFRTIDNRPKLCKKLQGIDVNEEVQREQKIDSSNRDMYKSKEIKQSEMGVQRWISRGVSVVRTNGSRFRLSRFLGLFFYANLALLGQR